MFKLTTAFALTAAITFSGPALAEGEDSEPLPSSFKKNVRARRKLETGRQ